MKNKNIENKKGIETLTKCINVIINLSFEDYEKLSVDEHKKMFGDWSLKELNCLYKLYEDKVYDRVFLR